MSETIERMLARLTVNGEVRTIVVEPRMTLLDALREKLGLTGTKKA
jgi:xanthine dehydrogenase YagT iron-sulfur-binding subunit